MADTPQQLLYAPDAARAIVAVTQCDTLKSHEVYNIGGTIVPTIRNWMETIAEIAGGPTKISIVPKAMVRILGLFIPVMREIASLAYKYETTVFLNDDKFNRAHPGSYQTPMRVAIAETLEWFEQNGSGGEARRKAKRRARVNNAVRFTVDNIAIVAFPAILLLLATQLPVLEGFTLYLAVAAGIYWTSGLHSVTDRIAIILRS